MKVIDRVDHLLAVRKPDMAADVLCEFLRNNPDDPTAHAYLARVHFMKGNFKEALCSAETAVHLDPEDDYSYYIKVHVEMDL